MNIETALAKLRRFAKGYLDTEIGDEDFTQAIEFFTETCSAEELEPLAKLLIGDDGRVQ